jgi:oxygen-independent coproporphyrinogen-3 oxidase
MGRTAFGDGQVFAQVVSLAHSRNMTVSGDLLFNLPGQPLAEMLADVASGCHVSRPGNGLVTRCKKIRQRAC